ncbi:MAG: alpha/beta fold hydrolase [Candidatus Omnitrophota bacterium]|nr:alpha/beta fold hydrolase [Candidatus Omnitrophota bacterium]
MLQFFSFLCQLGFLGIVLLVILLLFVGFLFVKSIHIHHLVSKVNPSRSYQESVKRIDDLRRLDGGDVSQDGRLIFLAHGEKTHDAIVFFHGNTNSPRQFEMLGKIFYEKGYNVLIPRIPHHGLKDRMTKDLVRLTALEMTQMCDESVDIAQGLGEHIAVVGFSMGANMAGWIAQNRSDVDKAVIIAPFWGWKGLPTGFFKPLINLSCILPNMFVWWDRKGKTALTGPTSSYYRFSTRGVAQIMRLGWSVMKEARSVAPKAQTIVVITSALDDTVNEKNLDRVVGEWQRHGGVKITRFQFDRSLDVFHDLIDPEQPYQKTAVVYPKLIELIEN